MIVDLESGAIPADFSAAICIVGAGAAGLILAAELTRRKIPVLLLESGGRDLENSAQTLSMYEPVGQPQQPPSIGRFRGLGGTTKAWGGQILPLTTEDFESRAWIRGSGWPVSLSRLQPYYDRAIRAEGLAPALQQDGAVWQTLGMPAPTMGDDLVPYFTRWCPEPDFARLHREIFSSPFLCVALHATVTAMILNSDGESIAGLRCRTISGRDYLFSAPTYALCLGTIDTVRLLMQPLGDGVHAPWNKSANLGRNLQAHIDFNAADVTPLDAVRLHRCFANIYLNGFKYHPKLRLAPAAQQRERMLNIAGFVTARHPAERSLFRIKAMGRNLIHGRFSGIARDDLSAAFAQLPLLFKLADGYVRKHRAHWMPGSDIRFRVHCEQEPRAQSYIQLTGERDATGMLRARFDWRVSPSEWRTIHRFTQIVEREFEQRKLAKLQLHPELLREDGFLGLKFENSHHVMGGSRMAEDPANGVVTPELRLHGVRNAFVCSASVFPTSGFSNPTHTLIALAIRLADHLAAQLGGPHA